MKKYPDITSQRVLEKVREQGYAGGYTIVRDRSEGEPSSPRRRSGRPPGSPHAGDARQDDDQPEIHPTAQDVPPRESALK